jgi:hypothetical protein
MPPSRFTLAVIVCIMPCRPAAAGAPRAVTHAKPALIPLAAPGGAKDGIYSGSGLNHRRAAWTGDGAIAAAYCGATTTGAGAWTSPACPPGATFAITARDERSLVALPEPASLALILVGVLGVTAVRARRARPRKRGP